MNRADIQRVQKAVVRVLNEMWDPIGVGPMGVSDEYDSHAITLTGMLLRNDPDTDLLGHLEWAESENMGFGTYDHSRGQRVLSALRAIPKISN